jgi:hypothetical protein
VQFEIIRFFICASGLQIVELSIAIRLDFNTVFNPLELFSFNEISILQLIARPA